MRVPQLAVMAMVLTPCAPVLAQSGASPKPLPASLGTLNQDDLSLRLRSDEIEIRFIPLDFRVTRLLAPDAFQSLRMLVETRRRAIDSVASRAGVTRPGLALVSFFGLRSDARFDPQTLTLLIRNRVYRPLGVVPINAQFTSQQLDAREQASAIYLFEEDIPVDDSFTLSYGALTSDDWQGKQPILDRERARVAARARDRPRDSTSDRR